MRRAAFDRPGLGLVLQLVGVFTLPTFLSIAGFIVSEDMWSAEIVVMTSLGLAVIALQIATGIAMVSRPRWAPVWFAAYAAATVALWIASLVTIDSPDATAWMFIGVAIETFGTPALLVAVALSSPDGEPRSAGDLGGVLLVLGLAALLTAPMSLVQELRWVTVADAGTWAARLIRLVLALLVASLEFAAAITLLRSGWPAARRRLWIYVLVTVLGELALTLVALISMIDDGIQLRMLLPSFIRIAIIPLSPLVKWRFARSLPDGVDRSSARVATLGWVALAFVPLLLGRVWILVGAAGQTHSRLPIGLAVLCAAQAILNAIAGVAAIRGSRATHIYAWAAMLVAIVLAISAVIWTFGLSSSTRFRLPQSTWPIAILLASSIAFVWLAMTNRDRDRDARQGT